MLTDIRALADHFLIALPNINTYHVIDEWGFHVAFSVIDHVMGE